MRIYVDEPRLDFRDARGIAGAFGLAEQRAALGIRREHETDQRCLTARRLLLDLTETGAAGQGDRAALGRELAGDEPEQCRLADAVAADQADARSGRQHRARALEEKAGPEPVGEVVDLQHRRLMPSQSARVQACLPPSGGAAISPRSSRKRTRTGRAMATERTFSILKPDATRRNLTGKINRSEERRVGKECHSRR